MINSSERPPLEVPQGENQVLLHSCCAPCSGDVMAELKRSKIQYTILFYNPNIHPTKEYELRKTENKRFATKLKVPFVDLDTTSAMKIVLFAHPQKRKVDL